MNTAQSFVKLDCEEVKKLCELSLLTVKQYRIKDVLEKMDSSRFARGFLSLLFSRNYKTPENLNTKENVSRLTYNVPDDKVLEEIRSLDEKTFNTVEGLYNGLSNIFKYKYETQENIARKIKDICEYSLKQGVKEISVTAEDFHWINIKVTNV